MQNKIIIVFLVFIFFSSCSSTQDSRINPANPDQIAKAFWEAVISKDYKRANKYVIPRDREFFTKKQIEKELKKLPPLPEDPIIKAEIRGKRGYAKITNWEYKQGFEMIFRKGRWWIEK